MRFKKQKRHRRAVRFYTACFGFREPFKVLCDGTFVHHLIVNHIVPADKALSNILGGPVKLFTSRCVLGELKSLGNSHSESLQAAHKLLTARCDHEDRKRADTCIMEIIGQNNLEHFFVATQDADLRKRLQEVPGVPLIFGLRNALFLEQPSAFQRQFAKTSEEERLHMTKLEKKLLDKKIKNMITNEQNEDASDENEELGEQNLEMQPVRTKHTSKKVINVKDKPQFKRKRAKGPNPLSRLKKKNREDLNRLSEKGDNAVDDSVRSRNRKRKRSRKGKTPTETENQ